MVSVFNRIAQFFMYSLLTTVLGICLLFISLLLNYALNV